MITTEATEEHRGRGQWPRFSNTLRALRASAVSFEIHPRRPQTKSHCTLKATNC